MASSSASRRGQPTGTTTTTTKTMLALIFFTIFTTTISAEKVHGAFVHGVASGDPTSDRVILWSRVTPTGRDPGEKDPSPDVTFAVTWTVSTQPPTRMTTKKATTTTSYAPPTGTQPLPTLGDAWWGCTS
jgi:phosphodiesterase/alkaline phosphatase D-like protein